MLAKLAFRNVRRAGRDYAIYFITVALGVALFYAFNAVHSQAILFDALSADSIRMLNLLNMMIGMFSVIVACVLGFLVVYANRFLIRRRRREFGTYLLLGMSAGRVSRVLLFETVLVGLGSLVVGLVLGIAVSQGLSFATAALMGTTMTKYQFIVSVNALGLTVLCFVAIFAVSALVDVIYIRRCKLITLLSAHEANERGGITRMPLRIAGFIVSLILLACAYWQLAINGMQLIDERFWAATILMVAGTFLFFWSIAGFVIFALTHAKGVYLKGIRMFTVRQIASKVNTAFISMSVVCVMLFLAMTTASVGMGLLELFTGSIEQATRYDATIQASPDHFDTPGDAWRGERDRYNNNIAACIADHTSMWNDVVRASAQVDFWSTNEKYQTLLDQIPSVENLKDATILASIGKTTIQVVPVSQVNDACTLIGEPIIELGEDKFMVINTIESFDDLGRAMASEHIQFDISGIPLHGQGSVRNIPLETSAMNYEALQIVVPDKIVAALKAEGAAPDHSYLNVMYKMDREQGDVALAQALSDAFPLSEGQIPASDEIDEQFKVSAWPVTRVYTGRAMADQSSGLRMVITFLALYIGFVMLVATAAVLAIQQLSETADSLGRYRRLSDLGCDMHQIFGSLRIQTVVYFCAPLALAACHTICAVTIVGNTLFSELGVNPTGLIGIAAGSIVCIYAVYLIATYLLSKGIVRTAIGQRREN